MSAPLTGENWRTPAATQLARDCLNAALRGRPVLLRARRAGAAETLTSIADEFAARAVRVDPRAGPDPLRAIAAANGLDHRAEMSSLLDLIASPLLRDAVLLVAVEGPDLRSWLGFAGLFSGARDAHRGDAAGLILISQERLRSPKGCEERDDDAVVDELDALTAVRAWSGRPSGLTAECGAQVAVETCRGDLDLLCELCGAGAAVMADPRAWCAGRPAPIDASPLPWRGREEPCPAWASRHDPPTLERRVWKGQLRILFPWLEEVRERIVSRYGSRLPAGARDAVTGEVIPVSLYEYTHLLWGWRRAGGDPGRHDALERLRAARNELAHGRALSASRIIGLERAAASLDLTT